MQSIHARGLVLSVICGLVCGCGATELNRGDPGGEADGSGAAGSASGGVLHSGEGGRATVGVGGTASNEALNAADAMALFGQDPHCGPDITYQLDGSIDGGTVHDGDDFVGGFSNGDPGKFTSSGVGFAPQPDRVGLNFEWRHFISRGQASTISNGTLIVPLGHRRAEERLCITRGVVGFPQRTDEAVFKFWLRAARLGPDCGGAEVPIDIRGCLN